MRWAVYPVETRASVATRAATSALLVTVATSERWDAIQGRTAQPPVTSTHFSALGAPRVPLRLTTTERQTVPPRAASTTNPVDSVSAGSERIASCVGGG